MTFKNFKVMLEHMPYFSFMQQDKRCFVSIEMNENNFAYAQKNFEDLLRLSGAIGKFSRIRGSNRTIWVYFGYDKETKKINTYYWHGDLMEVYEYNKKACGVYKTPQDFVRDLLKYNGNTIPIVR